MNRVRNFNATFVSLKLNSSSLLPPSNHEHDSKKPRLKLKAQNFEIWDEVSFKNSAVPPNLPSQETTQR